MGVGVGRDDDARGAERAEERLGRQRRVLVVVDEHVVEQIGAGLDRRQLHQPRIVNLIDRIERVEVLLCEAGELGPTAEPGGAGRLLEILGRQQRLLHPREQLAHLVGEPAHAEEPPVRGPRLGVLPGEQLAHQRELLGGPQHLGRLALAELQDAVAEPVEGQHLQAGERRREALEERGLCGVAGAA